MLQTRKMTRQHGFTLVELLVVITIIGILIALLLPAVQAAREAARRMQCTNNLKQMALGVHGFHESRGFMTPMYLTGRGHSTWMVIILPFLEQQSLYDQTINKTIYGIHQQSPSILKTQVAAYYCPTRRSPPQISTVDLSRAGVGPAYGALCDYAMNAGDGHGVGIGEWCGISRCAENGTLVGTDPTFEYKNWTCTRTFADVTDGLSNTLMIGEKHVPSDHLTDYRYGDGNFFNDDTLMQTCRLAGPSYPLASSPEVPVTPSASPLAGIFGCCHAGGACNFAMADGSVHALQPTIDSTILGYFSNIHDGHVTPAGTF